MLYGHNQRKRNRDGSWFRVCCKFKYNTCRWTGIFLKMFFFSYELRQKLLRYLRTARHSASRCRFCCRPVSQLCFWPRRLSTGPVTIPPPVWNCPNRFSSRLCSRRAATLRTRRCSRPAASTRSLLHSVVSCYSVSLVSRRLIESREGRSRRGATDKTRRTVPEQNSVGKNNCKQTHKMRFIPYACPVKKILCRDSYQVWVSDTRLSELFQKTIFFFLLFIYFV